MTAPLHNVIGTVEQMISTMRSVDGALSAGFNAGAISTANQAFVETGVHVDQVANEIKQAGQNQQQFNQNVQQGGSMMDGLTNKVMGMVAGYASVQGIKKLFDLSDTMTQNTARLNMMNDDLQTTKELQDMIFASAQRSRGAYLETADVVAKLGQRAGDAFASNQETIAFAENLNKMFVIAGASQQEMSSASLQLTQALGSGVLRGEELNAVFEAAPNVIGAIAKYMNVPIGKIKELASDGKITASIVKNAMLDATEEINAQFESMPMTWAQVWTGVMNELLYASQPLLNFINMLAQHWDVLEPIVIGAAVALGAYVVALGIYNGLKAAAVIAESLHVAKVAMSTGATFLQTAATKGATGAQVGFNAALLASPVTQAVLITIALIAALYGLVAIINKATGSTISATGLIIGGIATAYTFIINLFIATVNFIMRLGTILWNYIALFANFFGNVFNDPVGAIARLFFGLADTILALLGNVAASIDTLFGSHLQASIQGFRRQLGGMVDDKFGKGTEIMANRSVVGMSFGRVEYGAALEFGNKVGKGIDDKVGSLFGRGLEDLYGAGGAGGAGLGDYVEDIAGNTGSIADSVAMSEEDLKYLRDIAEQEAVNRFTTAEIRVEMTNNNSIGSGMDIDGVVNGLAIGVNEAMEKAAEGVHI